MQINIIREVIRIIKYNNVFVFLTLIPIITNSIDASGKNNIIIRREKSIESIIISMTGFLSFNPFVLGGISKLKVP